MGKNIVQFCFRMHAGALILITSIWIEKPSEFNMLQNSREVLFLLVLLLSYATIRYASLRLRCKLFALLLTLIFVFAYANYNVKTGGPTEL